MKPTKMTPALHKVLMESLKGGASSQGLTYHGNNLSCPKKARLDEMHKASKAEEEEDPEAPPGKFSWLRVGVFGHKLFELQIKGEVGLEVEVPAQGPDELIQAVNQYNFFGACFGDVASCFGARLIGAEVQLGESPGIALEVVQRLGDKLTGRADAIIEVRDPDRCYENIGLYLMPGRYLIDWKYGSKHGAGDELKFSKSLQAANYCWLDELQEGPGQGAVGTIFVRLIGHKTLSKDKSFAFYATYKHADDEQRLKSVVTMSVAMANLGLGNSLACVDSYGKECWWRKNGTCPGF